MPTSIAAKFFMPPLKILAIVFTSKFHNKTPQKNYFYHLCIDTYSSVKYYRMLPIMEIIIFIWGQIMDIKINQDLIFQIRLHKIGEKLNICFL